MAKEATCPVCGKQFTPWRKKEFCSEKCGALARKRRQRGLTESPMSRDESPLKAFMPDSQKPEKIDERNQSAVEQVSRDEGPARMIREAQWLACNEITHKLDLRGRALAWAMNVEGKGWFGRVRDERGDWSFGPSSLARCRIAAEAWLRREPFEKRDDERMWRGDCWRLLGGAVQRMRDDDHG